MLRDPTSLWASCMNFWWKLYKHSDKNWEAVPLKMAQSWPWVCQIAVFLKKSWGTVHVLWKEGQQKYSGVRWSYGLNPTSTPFIRGGLTFPKFYENGGGEGLKIFARKGGQRQKKMGEWLSRTGGWPYYIKVFLVWRFLIMQHRKILMCLSFPY